MEIASGANGEDLLEISNYLREKTKIYHRYTVSMAYKVRKVIRSVTYSAL